jgi:hypothetical protein
MPDNQPQQDDLAAYRMRLRLEEENTATVYRKGRVGYAKGASDDL